MSDGNKHLLLASSSTYRQALLSRLGLEFSTFSPDIDETHLIGESPKTMALRLATSKARVALNRYPDHVVVASDQVCALGQRVFGKPGDFASNVAQLQAFSGHVVDFWTAVAVGLKGEAMAQHIDRTRVQFRTLSEADIVNYVTHEQAHDCAGGFKVESRGPVLFESVTSSDPTGLVGLPLIATCQLLRTFGVTI